MRVLHADEGEFVISSGEVAQAIQDPSEPSSGGPYPWAIMTGCRCMVLTFHLSRSLSQASEVRMAYVIVHESRSGRRYASVLFTAAAGRHPRPRTSDPGSACAWLAARGAEEDLAQVWRELIRIWIVYLARHAAA